MDINIRDLEINIPIFMRFLDIPKWLEQKSTLLPGLSMLNIINNETSSVHSTKHVIPED
jgi:hypothetical protein